MRGFSRLEIDVSTLNLYKGQRGNTNGCFSPCGDSKKWKAIGHSKAGSSYSTQDDETCEKIDNSDLLSSYVMYISLKKLM